MLFKRPSKDVVHVVFIFLEDLEVPFLDFIGAEHESLV